MKRWYQLSAYPALLVFGLAGVFAALFSWNSYSLVTVAMENVRFLNSFGAVAIMEGGLVQLLEVVAKGFASLAFFLGFKACETELIHRWRSAGRE